MPPSNFRYEINGLEDFCGTSLHLISLKTAHLRRLGTTRPTRSSCKSLISNDSLLSLQHDGLLATTEAARIQAVLLQQAIELGAIAIRQPGRI